MNGYRLEFTRQAEHVLALMKQREPGLYRRMAAALDDLEANPFIGKPLKGELKGRYSHRVGSYRIIYIIERRRLTVVVIDIGHRRDVYR